MRSLLIFTAAAAACAIIAALCYTDCSIEWVQGPISVTNRPDKYVAISTYGPAAPIIIRSPCGRCDDDRRKCIKYDTIAHARWLGLSTSQYEVQYGCVPSGANCSTCGQPMCGNGCMHGYNHANQQLICESCLYADIVKHAVSPDAPW